MLTTFFANFLAFADAPPWQKLAPSCEKPAKKLLSQLNSANQWKQVVDIELGAVALRSPTKVIGRWVELNIHRQSKKLWVDFITPNQTERYHFNKKANCRQKRHVTKTRKPASVGTFADDDLAKLIKKGAGVIYIWTPGMVYSMEYLAKFRQYARKLKLPFLALMNPHASKRQVGQAIKSYGIEKPDLRKVDSIELEMRLYQLHFPATYIYKDGKIHHRRIIGVMEEDDFRYEALWRLNEL